MPAPIRAKLSLILPIIMTRLQAVTGLPEPACFLSQRKTMPYDALADSYIWVKVMGRQIQGSIYEGGGRIDTRETRIIRVTIRTRLALDEPNHDTAWLIDASLGHLDLADKVSDALTGFHVEDASGNILCTHPIEPTEGTTPEKDSKQPEWGEETLNFLISRELDLTQSYS